MDLQRIRTVVAAVMTALFVLSGERALAQESTHTLKAKVLPSAAKTGSPKMRPYVVQDKESLWRIARRFYGTGRAAERLAQLNGLDSPAHVRAGMTLQLPDEPEASDIVPLRTQTFREYDIRKQRMYRVAKDDSLWRIAQRYYGSGRAAQEIAERNGLRGATQLRPGMVLILDVPEYVEKRAPKVSAISAPQRTAH